MAMTDNPDPGEARAAVKAIVESLSPAAAEIMAAAAVARIERGPTEARLDYAHMLTGLDKVWRELQAGNMEASTAEAVQVAATALLYITAGRASEAASK